MGSESNPSKRHYDITMSKRTRKPPLNLSSPKKDIPQKGVDDKGEESSPTGVDDGGEENGHKSLKQLINGGGEVRVTSGEANKGRNSLGQHFTEEEEKHLQLVVKQQEEGMVGVKSKGKVSRYIKVLSHLIKAKRDPRLGSRKKPVLRLTM